MYEKITEDLVIREYMLRISCGECISWEEYIEKYWDSLYNQMLVNEIDAYILSRHLFRVPVKMDEIAKLTNKELIEYFNIVIDSLVTNIIEAVKRTETPPIEVVEHVKKSNPTRPIHYLVVDRHEKKN